MVTPGRRIKIGLAIRVRTPVLLVIVGPNKDQILLIVPDGKILRVLQHQTQTTSKPGDVPWSSHERKCQFIEGVDVKSWAVLNG